MESTAAVAAALPVRTQSKAADFSASLGVALRTVRACQAQASASSRAGAHAFSEQVKAWSILHTDHVKVNATLRTSASHTPFVLPAGAPRARWLARQPIHIRVSPRDASGVPIAAHINEPFFRVRACRPDCDGDRDEQALSPEPDPACSASASLSE